MSFVTHKKSKQRKKKKPEKWQNIIRQWQKVKLYRINSYLITVSKPGARSDLLRANPFPFKDKIVGLYTVFTQMISEKEAMFGGDLVATGVPSTLFTRTGVEVFLAVKVQGLRPIKILGSEISVPYGSYVGSYLCKQAGCSDFIGPASARPYSATEQKDFAAVLKEVEKLKKRPPQQPLTASEINTLREQIELCWNPPVQGREAENLIVEIRIRLNPDGSVFKAEIVDQERMASDGFFRAVAESAQRAVFMCSPLRLPADSYTAWQVVTLSFDPSNRF